MLKTSSGKHALGIGLIGLGLTFGAAAQTASAPMAGAGNKANVAAKTLPSADRAFVEKAAQGGMVEVALGKLAQQKAASDQVKQFGSRMEQDHSKANGELKQVAGAKGIELPAGLDKKHQKDVDHFGKMSGAEFDKAYMGHMVEDHKHDVADFKKEANGGKDADVKAFAGKTLPTLEEHLKLAQSTNDAVRKGGK